MLFRSERFLYVREECVLDSRLDDDVINVYLHVSLDLFLQASLHASLVCGASVLEPERHCCAAKDTVRRDE